MKKILQRTLDTIVAVVMIALSLAFQAIFFVLLGMGLSGILSLCGYEKQSDTLLYSIVAIAFLVFNSLAFYIYFRQGKANVSIATDASVFFYIPRAIDTILFGTQRVSRDRGSSDINPHG